jgi:hypothetical protein
MLMRYLAYWREVRDALLDRGFEPEGTRSFLGSSRFIWRPLRSEAGFIKSFSWTCLILSLVRPRSRPMIKLVPLPP